MLRFRDQPRLVIGITLLVLLGCVALAMTTYGLVRQAWLTHVADQVLPLSSDTVYSELQKDVLRPALLASTMAHNSFVRDWQQQGERDVGAIGRYLEQIKLQYGASQAVLVSDATRHQYQSNGLQKRVQHSDAQDRWYFRVREMKPDYEVSVDPDLAQRTAMTVFVYYRILGEDRRFLGAAALGLKVDHLARVLTEYQRRYQRRVYFVDGQGRVVLAGAGLARPGRLADWPGWKEHAAQLMAPGTVPKSLRLTQPDGLTLVHVRYVPELRWHLVVEQNAMATLQGARLWLAASLVLGMVLTLGVWALLLRLTADYRGRIDTLATTDQLTHLVNRQGMTLLFDQAVRQATRSGQPVSVLMMDLDHFKSVNDSYGQLLGDRVIVWMADLIKQSLRGSDVFARWGGEEFLALLGNCDLDQAVLVAEKIRLAVHHQAFQEHNLFVPLSISIGVSSYRPGETIDAVLARADKALYLAKQTGRNRVEMIGGA